MKKNKWMFLMAAVVVLAASFTQARTRRTVTVIDDVFVSPLDGYAGQVSSENEPAPSIDGSEDAGFSLFN